MWFKLFPRSHSNRLLFLLRAREENVFAAERPARSVAGHDETVTFSGNSITRIVGGRSQPLLLQLRTVLIDLHEIDILAVAGMTAAPSDDPIGISG